MSDSKNIRVFVNMPHFYKFIESFDEFLYKNIKNKTVRMIFERSKLIEPVNIRFFVKHESRHGSFNHKALISYDYEYILCLEYLIFSEKKMQDIKYLLNLFDIMKNDENIPLAFDEIIEFLNHCLKNELTCYVEYY